MIAIVDYGMGNLRSVERALQHVGGDARIVTTAGELAMAEKIVLPGVAAFGDAMDQLKAQRLVEPVIRAVKRGTPYLGLCLGLQLLFDVSYEDGEHYGMGLLPGKVVRFELDQRISGQSLRIPHMGWNQIQQERSCPMLDGLAGGEYMYFAHSFHVVPLEDDLTITTTDYGCNFTSAVWYRNIFATQFHPEKSQSAGLKILENFVRL
ncbi:MAG: imidazole glycerol phosphate synthase subunit HisH [Phycisphaerae bacterium]|nr:imidazole glycerol phosphate synthase subunit HisH [Phycisphaerae bacterium]